MGESVPTILATGAPEVRCCVESIEHTPSPHTVSDASCIARQQKQIETLTEGLQKVSAQLEVSKPAPQIVLADSISLPSQ
jgi:hypothetical protein